jgi:hypothetical protein
MQDPICLAVNFALSVLIRLLMRDTKESDLNSKLWHGSNEFWFLLDQLVNSIDTILITQLQTSYRISHEPIIKMCQYGCWLMSQPNLAWLSDGLSLITFTDILSCYFDPARSTLYCRVSCVWTWLAHLTFIYFFF